MKAFWVEGLFISKQKLGKVKKSGKFDQADLEPFARVIWAENRAEALLLANQALAGGEWVEGPQVSQTSEEQRMRTIGAPELPGLASTDSKRKSK